MTLSETIFTPATEVGRWSRGCASQDLRADVLEAGVSLVDVFHYTEYKRSSNKRLKRTKDKESENGGVTDYP